MIDTIELIHKRVKHEVEGVQIFPYYYHYNKILNLINDKHFVTVSQIVFGCIVKII